MSDIATTVSRSTDFVDRLQLLYYIYILYLIILQPVIVLVIFFSVLFVISGQLHTFMFIARSMPDYNKAIIKCLFYRCRCSTQ